jgi:hypothetical protein
MDINTKQFSTAYNNEPYNSNLHRIFITKARDGDIKYVKSHLNEMLSIYKDRKKDFCDYALNAIFDHAKPFPQSNILQEARIDIMKLFINNGATILNYDTYYDMCLGYAIRFQEKKIIEFLLSIDDGRIPFNCISYIVQADMFDYFISKIEFNPDIIYMFVVHAIADGKINIVKYFRQDIMRHKMKIDFLIAALHFFIENKQRTQVNLDILKLINESGANISDLIVDYMSNLNAIIKIEKRNENKNIAKENEFYDALNSFNNKNNTYSNAKNSNVRKSNTKR